MARTKSFETEFKYYWLVKNVYLRIRIRRYSLLAHKQHKGEKRSSSSIKTTEEGNYNKYRDEGLKAEVQGYSLYIDNKARVLTSAGDLLTSTHILATRLDDGANN